MRSVSGLRLAWALAFVWGWWAAGPAGAAVATQDVEVQGEYLGFTMTPKDGCVVSRYGLLASPGDYAGDYGMLLEGFGVGSPYVPSRRLNERLETDDSVAGRPVLRYSYDCDGANIRGLHVTRTVEAFPNEASLLVRWRIEHKGAERQWVTPWVRNDALPGGNFTPESHVDVPTLNGLERARRMGYFPASRNWVAATDPVSRVAVCGVFNAEHTHSFLTLWDGDGRRSGFHTAFVPRLMNPGDVWETVYRINAVRGLTHVDFAAEELAGQLDYTSGKLEFLVASAKPIPEVEIHASVVAENGRRWVLQPKRFATEPNHLIRCTYAWTAPADGVYDFLAQLQQGGAPYELNRNVAAPHGGIDTQFVVGKPKGPRRMTAWTDAPFAVERGQREVTRQAAYRGAWAMWFESSLEKVFRNDQPVFSGPDDPVARVSLARNEREGFQVVVRPGKDEQLFETRFEVGDLVHTGTGAVLAASNVQVSNVVYYPVRIPSYFEGPSGEWPDALPPFEPFTAHAERCYPVWFTVYAPPGTAAGTYRGPLVMKANGVNPVPLTLEVTVYDFELPVTPALKTDFGFWPDKAAETAAARGGKLPVDAIREQYAANAFAHRVTLREVAQLPAPGGDYGAALAQYLPRLKDLLVKGATTFAAPPSLIDNVEQLRQADAFVAANNLQGRVFCQVSDEPPPPAWPVLVERMKVWRAAAPNIPLMVTTFGLQPFLPDGVGIWAVHTPVMDTLNNKPVLERVQQGGGNEVWWYVNHRPSRPYANFFIDLAGMEHRILFWQAWALGARGLHYWGVNYTEPGQDPYADLVDVTPVNGDGFLVYPGPEGPVNSIRWENIRDGIEDYDYLTILMQRMRRLQSQGGRDELVRRAAQTLDFKELAPDLVSFPRDPKVLAARRDAVARMIMEVSAAP